MYYCYVLLLLFCSEIQNESSFTARTINPIKKIVKITKR
jgi:hypothetical protein